MSTNGSAYVVCGVCSMIPVMRFAKFRFPPIQEATGATGSTGVRFALSIIVIFVSQGCTLIRGEQP
jgi:hypothetical protein